MLLYSERGYVLPPEEAAVLIAQLQLGYSRVDADQIALENADRALVDGAYDYVLEQRSRR